MNESIPAPELDWWGMLTDEGFHLNPHPALTALQSQAPIHFDQASGVYFITRHAEFTQIARAPQFGRDTRRWAGGWNSPEGKQRDPLVHELLTEFQPQMINNDPPVHGRMRGVYEKAFRPAAIEALAPMIQSETDLLLDAMSANPTAEFMDAFATPMPLRVLRNQFEFPEEMDRDIARWSAALIRLNDIVLTTTQKEEALASLREFKEYLRGFLALRKAAPGSGLIDAVIAASEDGTMDAEETVTNLVSMLVAGWETTVTLIGNGMLALLQHPREFARLRENPQFMRTAIEEFLRFEPGGSLILRVALQDYELSGTLIPEGAMVIGLIIAINRDPLRFDRPDVFDVARHPNPHHTFGSGIHLCIGAPLARLEARIAFESLLKRFSSIEPDGPFEWRFDRTNARMLRSLPIRTKGTSSKP